MRTSCCLLESLYYEFVVEYNCFFSLLASYSAVRYALEFACLFSYRACSPKFLMECTAERESLRLAYLLGRLSSIGYDWCV